MNEQSEIIVYDALAMMQENYAAIASCVQRHGTKSEKEAVTKGLYVPCVKLQCALGQDGLARGRARHEQIRKEVESFFANKRKANERTNGTE